MARHKVFISYHHGNDQAYREKFEVLFSKYYDIIVSKSVQIGDIDPNNNTEYVRQLIRDNYLADSTVTIVLVGTQTWQRKHVDWEIGSSIRDTQNNPRSGLLGILLPTHSNYGESNFNGHTIPPRLYDNYLKDKYAMIYDWSENPQNVAEWIDAAFSRRTTVIPDNSRESFSYNRTGERWQ